MDGVAVVVGYIVLGYIGLIGTVRLLACVFGLGRED